MNDFFWNGNSVPRNRILFGVLGTENEDKPGTYRFSSNDGYVVPDAHLLAPDADVAGGGDIARPRPGSVCIALTTDDGGGCYITGYVRPPEFDEESDDDPVVGNPDDTATAGDKIYKTTGGALISLKRGGAVIIEGGVGTGIIMNPVNNHMLTRSANFTESRDGYRAVRGRQNIGGTSPYTRTQEDHQHQVGPSYDRVRIQHGSFTGDARRQLSIASVTTTGTETVGVIRTRETYYSDGSWVGEGPKYQWGGSGASEPAVLGNELVDAINELIDIIKELKVNTFAGPSTPPLPDTQAKLTALSNELSGKILSSYLFFSKDPATLGTE